MEKERGKDFRKMLQKEATDEDLGKKKNRGLLFLISKLLLKHILERYCHP